MPSPTPEIKPLAAQVHRELGSVLEHVAEQMVSGISRLTQIAKEQRLLFEQILTGPELVESSSNSSWRASVAIGLLTNFDASTKLSTAVEVTLKEINEIIRNGAVKIYGLQNDQKNDLPPLDIIKAINSCTTFRMIAALVCLSSALVEAGNKTQSAAKLKEALALTTELVGHRHSLARLLDSLSQQ